MEQLGGVSWPALCRMKKIRQPRVALVGVKFRRPQALPDTASRLH
jgi:hypothetical protein